jgi:methylenetetrahydrofolate dehydrogenase (NADP+)/methenyltetrahydrofolate cyclohydrolase
VDQAQIMDGTALAASITQAVADRAAAFENGAGRRACLATVLVGDDPASATYVRMKRRRCEQAGLTSRLVHLSASTSTEQLVAVIAGLSVDPEVDGILLQHPVPPQVDERAAFEAIAPGKDVDGVTMTAFAQMAFGLPGFASCTPGGIIRLLEHHDVTIAGAHAVVVGRSAILGKPVGMLLLQRHATVTFCHSRTRDLAEHVREGDIVVAAVGQPELIRGSWLRPGSVVVDAGYNQGNVGDVEFGAASHVRLITPVPGGVGPMTLAVLLEQTVDAAERASYL